MESLWPPEMSSIPPLLKAMEERAAHVSDLAKRELLAINDRIEKRIEASNHWMRHGSKDLKHSSIAEEEQRLTEDDVDALVTDFHGSMFASERQKTVIDFPKREETPEDGKAISFLVDLY